MEELDIRLKIHVANAFEIWRSYEVPWRGFIPEHECNTAAQDEDRIERAVKHYVASLTGHNPDFVNHHDVLHDQRQVLCRLADALPNLRKVWFWAKLPEEGGEKCRM